MMSVGVYRHALYELSYLRSSSARRARVCKRQQKPDREGALGSAALPALGNHRFGFSSTCLPLCVTSVSSAALALPCTNLSTPHAHGSIPVAQTWWWRSRVRDVHRLMLRAAIRVCHLDSRRIWTNDVPAREVPWSRFELPRSGFCWRLQVAQLVERVSVNANNTDCFQIYDFCVLYTFSGTFILVLILAFISSRERNWSYHTLSCALHVVVLTLV